MLKSRKQHPSHHHVLPMGVVATPVESSKPIPFVRPNDAGVSLRRRLARSRVHFPAPAAASTLGDPTENTGESATERDGTVTTASLVGYRRLISELFGQAGIVFHSQTATAHRLPPPERRALRLVDPSIER